MQARALPLPLVGSVYVTSHLLFDALSYVDPFGAFGITPWNPSTGLGFLFVLLYGWRALPFYLVALLLANIVVRGLPVPPPRRTTPHVARVQLQDRSISSSLSCCAC
jgi:hypothetical protein